MSNSPPPETPQETKIRPEHAAVRELAHHLSQDHPITSGDRAALRRMHQGIRPAAFWRLVTMVLEPKGLVRDVASEQRWAAIIGLMAEAAGLHVANRRLGAALSEAKVAETRVLRLLNAQSDGLVDALRYAIRPLIVGGSKFDQTALADLILTDGDPERAEKPRHAIARAFYGAEFKKTQPSTP